MTRKTYTAEYKTKLVLKAIREESRLEEIAAANEINPNMLRNWKQEAALEKEKTKMLKKIGQLTLERDFLQDCFRACDVKTDGTVCSYTVSNYGDWQEFRITEN